MPGLFDKPTLGPCKVELWDFQWRAIDAVRAEFKRGVRRTLLSLATGLGKTVIAGMIARLTIENGKRVLFLVHTDELVQQTADKFDMLGVEPAIEQAQQFARQLWDDPDAVVASVQSLSQPGRLSSWKGDYFDLIIVDEGHRVLAPTYKRILAHFSKAKVLVLTATPLRSDDQEIGHVCESLAFRFTVLDAWEEERRTGQQYLCDARIRRCDVGIDLRKLKPQKGDFNREDVAARVAPMMEAICNKTREYIEGIPTVSFWGSIQTAQMYAAGMANWFPSEAVWGDDPDRERKIVAYRAGDLMQIANMNMLIEGWDVPSTAAVVLGRPTKSWSMILQQIGRGLRAGKPYCTIVDFDWLTDQYGDSPASLFVQPLGVLGGHGFDQEINRIIAETLAQKPEMSLKTAIEEARHEFGDRQRRKQFAIKVAIAERQVDCYEESFSMKAVAGDGEVVTGTAPARTADFKPATEGQIRFLKALGVEGCERWSRGRAGTTISYLKRQREAGKSSIRQRQKLIRNGVDAGEAREMTVQQATDAIDRYAARREQVYGRR